MAELEWSSLQRFLHGDPDPVQEIRAIPYEPLAGPRDLDEGQEVTSCAAGQGILPLSLDPHLAGPHGALGDLKLDFLGPSHNPDIVAGSAAGSRVGPHPADSSTLAAVLVNCLGAQNHKRSLPVAGVAGQHVAGPAGFADPPQRQLHRDLSADVSVTQGGHDLDADVRGLGGPRPGRGSLMSNRFVGPGQLGKSMVGLGFGSVVLMAVRVMAEDQAFPGGPQFRVGAVRFDSKHLVVVFHLTVGHGRFPPFTWILYNSGSTTVPPRHI